MRAVRVGVTDALHDRDLTRVVARLELLQVGAQADLAVERQHLLARDGQRRARLVVERIVVGNQRVEAVVAAGHLEHDQDAATGIGVPRADGSIGPPNRPAGARKREARSMLEHTRRLGHKGRHGQAGRHQDGPTLEKISSVHSSLPGPGLLVPGSSWNVEVGTSIKLVGRQRHRQAEQAADLIVALRLTGEGDQGGAFVGRHIPFDQQVQDPPDARLRLGRPLK